MKKWIKENKISIIMWLIFEIVATSLLISTKKIFYLLNFTYIGTFVALGIYLMAHKNKYARNIDNLLCSWNSTCIYTKRY